MTQHKPKRSLTDTLRATIVASGKPLLAFERELGIQRASLRRFLAGKQSLRLDIADRLADYFGLELTNRKGK